MNQEHNSQDRGIRSDQASSAPEQRRRRRWMGPLAIGLLVMLGGIGLLFGPSLLASEQEKPAVAPARPAMPVETAEVRIAESSRLLAAVGSLQSEESVTIAAELPGRVDRIGFNEGESTPKGRLLISLDSAVLQAELDRAVASRDLSRVNHQRAENLLKDRAISTRERDEAYAKWQLDEANVRLAKAQLAKAGIRAPFAGTLGLRTVSRGDYVQPGQPLVNLEAIEQLKVEFRIPEKYFAEVKVGQSLTLQSDAYPDRDFVAEVYAIDPQVEVQTRSLVVRGRLDNSDRALLPGQFVKVQLSVATRAGALFIPEQALLPQPKAVLVVKVIDGIAQMVPVETGQRLKGWVEIIRGLAAGDVVVTGGHQKIGPGSSVKPVSADPALFTALN